MAKGSTANYARFQGQQDKCIDSVNFSIAFQLEGAPKIWSVLTKIVQKLDCIIKVGSSTQFVLYHPTSLQALRA